MKKLSQIIIILLLISLGSIFAPKMARALWCSHAGQDCWEPPEEWVDGDGGDLWPCPPACTTTGKEPYHVRWYWDMGEDLTDINYYTGGADPFVAWSSYQCNRQPWVVAKFTGVWSPKGDLTGDVFSSQNCDGNIPGLSVQASFTDSGQVAYIELQSSPGNYSYQWRFSGLKVPKSRQCCSYWGAQKIETCYTVPNFPYDKDICYGIWKTELIIPPTGGGRTWRLLPPFKKEYNPVTGKKDADEKLVICEGIDLASQSLSFKGEASPGNVKNCIRPYYRVGYDDTVGSSQATVTWLDPPWPGKYTLIVEGPLTFTQPGWVPGAINQPGYEFPLAVMAPTFKAYVFEDPDVSGTKDDLELYKDGAMLTLENDEGETYSFTRIGEGQYKYIEVDDFSPGNYRVRMDLSGLSDSSGTKWSLGYEGSLSQTGVDYYEVGGNKYLTGPGENDYPIVVNPTDAGKTFDVWLGIAPLQYGTITGKVYQATPGGQCSGTSNPPAGWSVTCSNGTTVNNVAAKISGSDFSCCADWNGGVCNEQLPYGTYIISLTAPAGWGVLTGAGCGQSPTSVVLGSVAQGVTPFYLWQGAGAWFQTKDGDVHAGGSLRSKIPATCVLPTCDPKFSLSGNGGYPGVVSYGGSLGTEPFGKGTVSAKGWLANTAAPKKSYGYFYQLLGSPRIDNFNGEPSDITADGVYYSADDVTLNNDWTLSASRKVAILINGKLRLNKKVIVPVGSSLAFVVKGDIEIRGTVGERVGQAGASSPDIEGIYLSDGIIKTNYDGDQSGNRFVGAGIFVADQFSLARDLKASNSVRPAELFIYRADLLFNSFQGLWQAGHSWQELAP